MTKDLRDLIEKYEELYELCQISWDEKIVEIDDLIEEIGTEEIPGKDRLNLGELFYGVDDTRLKIEDFYRKVREFADKRITELENQEDTKIQESVKTLNEQKERLEAQIKDLVDELENVEQEIEYLQDEY